MASLWERYFSGMVVPSHDCSSPSSENVTSSGHNVQSEGQTFQPLGLKSSDDARITDAQQQDANTDPVYEAAVRRLQENGAEQRAEGTTDPAFAAAVRRIEDDAVTISHANNSCTEQRLMGTARDGFPASSQQLMNFEKPPGANPTSFACPPNVGSTLFPYRTNLAETPLFPPAGHTPYHLSADAARQQFTHQTQHTTFTPCTDYNPPHWPAQTWPQQAPPSLTPVAQFSGRLTHKRRAQQRLGVRVRKRLIELGTSPIRGHPSAIPDNGNEREANVVSVDAEATAMQVRHQEVRAEPIASEPQIQVNTAQEDTSEPSPKLEHATKATPSTQLCYPACLVRENTANQHKWADRGNHSNNTVFVVTHHIGLSLKAISVFEPIKEANLEVLNLMVKHHPEVFVVPPATQTSKPIKEEDEPETIHAIFDRECVVRSTGGIGGEEELPIVIKDENEDDNPQPAPANERTRESEQGENEKAPEVVDLEQRYLYGGTWKFGSSHTLKLFAKLVDGTEVRISCSLKNSRQATPKKKRKQGERGNKTATKSVDLAASKRARCRGGAGGLARQ